MTTVTNTKPVSVDVPVPTALTKAVLAGALGHFVANLVEGLVTPALEGLWSIDEYLIDDGSADAMVDDYTAAIAPALEGLNALLSLRRVAPGDGVSVSLPIAQSTLLSALGSAIEYLTETDVSEFLYRSCSQRQVAEALIVAIDLRDGMGGGA